MITEPNHNSASLDPSVRAHAFETCLEGIAYRIEQTAQRPVSHGESGLQDFVANTRYTRHREDLGRREVWSEASDRTRDMHLRRFANKLTADLQSIARNLRDEGLISEQAYKDMGTLWSLEEEIKHAFSHVAQKQVLPSMRSLQFGGGAIEAANARMFNCSFSHANRKDFFREYFYLLLCGCGVGFSVQKHHVSQLPTFAARGKDIELTVKHVEIADTIEGWSDAINELFEGFMHGYLVEFSYAKIRDRGVALKTSGGKAPGHLPLKTALVACEKIMRGAAGRQLRPIEVYDICMFIAKAVLSGGIRRSATICLFSPDDEEMMNAKTGDWFSENPQRSASNNSAVLVRGDVTREQFNKLFEAQKAFGEPGIDTQTTSPNPGNTALQANTDLSLASDHNEPLRDHQCAPGRAESHVSEQAPQCSSLTGASLMLTPAGLRKLEDLSSGDLAWTTSGWASIESIEKLGSAQISRYCSTVGFLECGPSQLVLLDGLAVPIAMAPALERLTGRVATARADAVHDSRIVMDGLVLGDGSVHHASNDLVILFVGKNDQDYFTSEVAPHLLKARPGIKDKAWEIATRIHADELPPLPYRTIPDRYVYGDFITILSILRGIYSANGSVVADRVTLKSTSLVLIQQVQLMLSSVGIASYFTTNQPNVVKFSNGSYECRESYDLNIMTDREAFMRLIGFLQNYKTEKLAAVVARIGKSLKKKAPISAIRSIEPKGESDVYALKLRGRPRAVWVNGVAAVTC